MKVVIQRSKNASVCVNEKLISKIDHGYVVLVGFTHTDNMDILNKMAEKLANLRIFEDENSKMNKSIKDEDGSILLISQFTLYAKLNGRRPSFSLAMEYNLANDLYNKFVDILQEKNIDVKKGIFGANMKVSLINDGPVTIIIDSDKDF